MLDKRNWSPRKFSWFYAALMAAATLLGAITAISVGIVQLIHLRVIYIVSFFLGLILFIRDLAKNSDKEVPYRKTFFYCMRTGIYTCFFLFPVVLAVLYLGLPNFGFTDQGNRLSAVKNETGLFLSMFWEMAATILMGSFVAVFIPGIVQRKK